MALIIACNKHPLVYVILNVIRLILVFILNYLNIFSLRVIPNTQLAKDMEEKGFDVPSIKEDYFTGIHRTMGNILVYALAVGKVPQWLYKILRKKVYPVQTKQPSYPILFFFVRTTYLFKKAFDHLRFMDFSVLPGKPGYYLWKFGVISFWHRYILKRYRLSKKDLKSQMVTIN